MPIYAYKCSSCGHARDVMQKISDAPLTECPACGASSFSKQVTAAGFQLKGSGWYVTDFRDKGGKKNGEAPANDSPKDSAKESSKGAADTPAKPAAADSAKESSSSGSGASAPAAAPAPAPGSGSAT